MNPQYIDATNVDNNSDNTTETESQQCMSDSVTKSYNSFFGDEHLPEGHITAHPFSLTLEELSDLLKNGQESCESVTTKPEAISQNLQVTHHQDCSGSTEDSRELSQSKPAENSGCLNQSTFSGFIQDGQPNQTKSETPQTILNQEYSVPTDYSVGKFSHKSVKDSRKNNKSTSVGQLSDSSINCEKAQPLETKPNQEFRVSIDYSVEKFSNKPVRKSGENKKSTSVGQLSDSSINCEKAQPLETKPNQEFRVSIDYSVEKFSNKPVRKSGENKKSTSVGQLSDSPINCEKAQPLETKPHQESRVSIDYSVEKFSNKPVGGSGWLHKYTKLTETKTGLVEYPRVKEGQRSTNNPKHWYWNYCWHKKGKNGKPLYKKGKAVVSSVGCPQKKVRVVEGAITSKLPHRQILEIIKGDNSPPPPT